MNNVVSSDTCILNVSVTYQEVVKQVGDPEATCDPEKLPVGPQSTLQSLTVTEALHEAGSLDDGPWLDEWP